MLKNLIILFAMVGVCSFIAASYYSNSSSQSANAANASEVEAHAQNTQTHEHGEHDHSGDTNAQSVPANVTIDVEAVKKAAMEKTITPSVPDGAVDVHPAIYGDESAPIIIEEFASFTCSHCASFHRDLLPALKKSLIDSGLAQLRVYSFVRNAQDLEATMLIQCQKDNESRLKFTGALMRGQEQWAMSADYQAGLKTIARVGGMDEDAYSKCVDNEAVQEKIIASRQWFDKQVKVDATPYFRVGNQVVKGASNVQAFEKAILEAIK